ncbi:MAG: polysaccharide biosynthesis protein [bacterium]|nr:polysaccharide biosynthesis protein [bacterium]
MKKKRVNKNKDIMKKNNFVQGAFIATLGIVITKILGILYVIPFYAIIGEQGGALYGYAYSIYLVFMAISSAGIPLAISKIISEYQTLGYYDAKQRAFKIGKQIATTLGILCFIILFVFAPQIATAILGDLKGGNTIEDVTFVIRVISTAITVVPVLSIYRGYFEGHKFITPTAVSQVFEQVVRVLVIVVGSFLTLKVFNLSLTTAVGVAVFGATVGSFASYFYLIEKRFKNKKKFEEKELNVKEPKITNKQILKKIMIYAFPLIMIDIFKSLYSVVDTVTVVKTLGPIYGTKTAESIMSILSTWAAKFNMIIISISTGMIVSLTPNLTASAVVGNTEDVKKKINQSFQMLIFLILPMTVGLSFLAKPVYTVFYGASKYGPSVLSFYVYVALITALFTTAITITQVLKYYKVVFVSLASGLILKSLINVSLINQLYNLGLPGYYGSVLASILGYGLSFIICLIALHKKCGVNYEKTIKQTINALCGTVLMVLVLSVVKLVVPISVASRFLNILIIAIYAAIGMITYFIYMKKTHSIDEVFGKDFLNKFKKKKKRA